MTALWHFLLLVGSAICLMVTFGAGQVYEEDKDIRYGVLATVFAVIAICLAYTAGYLQ